MNRKVNPNDLAPPPPPPPPPPPAPLSSRAPLTATKSCPSPSQPPADLMDAIRSHKGVQGLKRAKPTKSKTLDLQDELKARITQRRQAVSGEERPSKGMARSLSDMISEPEFVADTPDFFEDSSEGEFCLNSTYMSLCF